MQRAGAEPALVLTRGGPAEKALAMAVGDARAGDGNAGGEADVVDCSAAFLAAMCAAMVWFAGRPDWRVLFSGLDGKDVQQVSQELAAAGIPYRDDGRWSGSAGAGGDAGQGSDGGGGEGHAADGAAGV